jgi:hypothetical protein
MNSRTVSKPGFELQASLPFAAARDINSFNPFPECI